MSGTIACGAFLAFGVAEAWLIYDVICGCPTLSSIQLTAQASSLLGEVIAIGCAVLDVLDLVVLLLLDWTHTYPISLPSSQRIFQLLVPLEGTVGQGM